MSGSAGEEDGYRFFYQGFGSVVPVMFMGWKRLSRDGCFGLILLRVSVYGSGGQETDWEV